MICPHCTIGVRLPISGSSHVYQVEHEREKQWGYDIAHGFCPECSQLIVLIRHGTYWQQGLGEEALRELYPKEEQVIYPKRRTKPLSSDVPARYRNDFNEAFACLDVTPKASAAVSRRVLQDVLENHYNISTGNLASEIEAFVARPDVPPYLSQQVDAVRNIGNFAAHPLKSTRSGEIRRKPKPVSRLHLTFHVRVRCAGGNLPARSRCPFRHATTVTETSLAENMCPHFGWKLHEVRGFFAHAFQKRGTAEQ